MTLNKCSISHINIDVTFWTKNTKFIYGPLLATCPSSNYTSVKKSPKHVIFLSWAAV